MISLILNCISSLLNHSITDASEEIARHYRNSIIMDGVVYPRMTNAEILRLVRSHLFSHVVRMPFGDEDCNYYTQVLLLLHLHLYLHFHFHLHLHFHLHFHLLLLLLPFTSSSLDLMMFKYPCYLYLNDCPSD